MSGRSTRENRRQALAEARRAEQRRKHRLKLAGWGGAVVIVAGGGIGLGFGLSGSGSGAGASVAGRYVSLSTLGPLKADPPAGSTGPEDVPVPDAPALAGPSPKTTGQMIDAIACTTAEQTVFHIHTHLTIFVNGQQKQVPAGIGIPLSTPV